MPTISIHDRSRTRAGRTEAAIVRQVERAAAGDEFAWHALVHRFNGLVWAVTRSHRLSDDDAADVVQTVWMRLFEHLDRLRDPARVGVWLTTTARHECQALRRPARLVLVPSGDDLPEPVDEHAPGHDDSLLKRERDAALWESVERLSERDQALLRLLVSDHAPSYEEIGASLEMPIGSIGPTRARALERLRREIPGDSESLLAA